MASNSPLAWVFIPRNSIIGYIAITAGDSILCRRATTDHGRRFNLIYGACKCPASLPILYFIFCAHKEVNIDLYHLIISRYRRAVSFEYLEAIRLHRAKSNLV